MRKRRAPTRQELGAMASFEALMRKWDAVPKFARAPHRATQAPAPGPVVRPGSVPARATAERPPSLDTGLKAATKPVESLRYTGDKILGIAAMHKSNLVPVFSDEAAVDLARMRRG